MDAFYASVEQSENPSLRGKPVIVGGLSDHGIVTTASYEARKYGVRSAMPIYQAKKLCPHGVFIKTRIKKYQEVSREIFKTLFTYTNQIEKVSIDEAYIDTEFSIDPLVLIEEVRKEILEKFSLTLSIGLSYNKFLAKIASDWNKPSGFMAIDKSMLPELLLPLDIQKVHGIGPKTANKLNKIGIYKVGDLYRLSEDFLIEMLGKSGSEIYERVRGVDQRPLELNRERKSLGIERTFEEDTSSRKDLEGYLLEFSNELEEELLSKGFRGKTISIKLKNHNFKTITRSKTINSYVYEAEKIYEVSKELLEEISFFGRIRLLGISLSNLIDIDLEQLSLFD